MLRVSDGLSRVARSGRRRGWHRRIAVRPVRVGFLVPGPPIGQNRLISAASMPCLGTLLHVGGASEHTSILNARLDVRVVVRHAVALAGDLPASLRPRKSVHSNGCDLIVTVRCADNSGASVRGGAIGREAERHSVRQLNGSRGAASPSVTGSVQNQCVGFSDDSAENTYSACLMTICAGGARESAVIEARQVSKPAVSPVSKSAGRKNFKRVGFGDSSRVWKPATRQTWKSALRYAGVSNFEILGLAWKAAFQSCKGHFESRNSAPDESH